MIFIQGAMISPSRYKMLLIQIQKQIPNMAIAIPSFFANMPLPPFLNKIDVIESQLRDKYKISNETKCHYAGHSIGQAMLQI